MARRRQVSRAPVGGGAGGGEPSNACWPSRRRRQRGRATLGLSGWRGPRPGLRAGRRPGPRGGLLGRRMLRDPGAAGRGHGVPGLCHSLPTATGAWCPQRAAEEPPGLRGKGTTSRGGAFADSRSPGSPGLSVPGTGGGGGALSRVRQALSAGCASWCRSGAGSLRAASRRLHWSSRSLSHLTP